MSSEPTEPQETDEGAEQSDGPDDDANEERLEARAQEPTRAEKESDAADESEKPVVPAPSETEADSSDEDSESSEAADADSDGEIEGDEAADADSEFGEDSEETLAEDSSDAEFDDDSLAEDSSDAEFEDDSLAEDSSEAGLDRESSEAELAEESEPESPEQKYTDLDEQAEEWLDELFEKMHLSADAELNWDEGRPHVDIRGSDARRLLGRGKLGPKAVEGIETLLQSVFSEDDDASEVYVDVGGERAARKEMLQEVAVSMADKSVDLDEKLTISGLNSTERRIIHRKLRDYDGVDTESVGEGIFRRLVIDPHT